MTEQRQTESSVPTTGTVDNPKCTCCNPANFLEPPTAGNANWVCPVSGKEYSYDPGEGVAREVDPTTAQANAQTENPDRQPSSGVMDDDDLRPYHPGRETRRSVDPTSDKFA